MKPDENTNYPSIIYRNTLNFFYDIELFMINEIHYDMKIIELGFVLNNYKNTFKFKIYHFPKEDNTQLKNIFTFLEFNVIEINDSYLIFKLTPNFIDSV